MGVLIKKQLLKAETKHKKNHKTAFKKLRQNTKKSQNQKTK
jgi:hypothetical protein